MKNPVTRRKFVTRMALLPGVAIAAEAFAADSRNAQPDDRGEVSHASEAIHQEVVFKASRARIYEALTDTKQFDKMIEISGVMRGTSLGNKPTEISREVGGSFTLFGGHIIGRHIELVRDERIVQAWRVIIWDPGVYSIAKLALMEQGAATKLIFDHTGFPLGQGKHLADGWKEHYWEPLRKYLE